MNFHSKNRRDGKTVQTRVLTLIDKIGSDLFEAAVDLGVDLKPTTGEGDLVLSPKKRRRRSIRTRSLL